MEEYNPRLKKAILQGISNQLRMNDPPETKATLNRLISGGYSKQDAKELIGAVVLAHIYEMLKDQYKCIGLSMTIISAKPVQIKPNTGPSHRVHFK